MTTDGPRRDAAVSGGPPMYAHLEQQLRRRIESAEWPPGSMIPSERELCEVYGVSRITVRHALQRLVDRGLVVRKQGRGSFVRTTELTAGTRSVRSFTAEVLDLGMKPASRLLSVSSEPAPDKVADALGLATSAPVFRIHRVRLGDDEPIGVQTSYLRADRFPDFTAIDVDGQSLYRLLELHYGIVPVEARETFLVGVADADVAGLLDVPEGAAVFHVERITYDDDLAFEYVASVMRGDRYRVTVAIRNR